MPKPPARSPVRTAGAGKRPRPRDRRAGREHGERVTARPVASQAMRLAAEIEALKAELARTRAEAAALAARADVDPLLDILNRRGFERELARSLAHVRRYGGGVALLYLDLDGFKPVNDRYGHAAGDAVLRAVAVTLTRRVRASDVVARLGGDEFAVLLWNLSDANAGMKAAALESMIGQTRIRWGRAVLSVGASVGVAVLSPADDPAHALARADRAMYARKAMRAGRRGDPASREPP